MGKGAGEKSRFHKFLDESYFAFWFRQWAAGFAIIGIILIIVGAVVSQVIPPQKYKEFAQAQLVTSASDANYDNWATKIEKVRYDFMDVDPSTLDKTLKGPYVYSRILTKADVSFTATTVKYTLHVSKTFSLSESQDPSEEISLINPTYANLVSATSNEDEKLFADFDQVNNLGGKIRDFFTNEAYKYLGALGLAKQFPSAVTLVRENRIFQDLFSPSGLGKAITDYHLIFASTYLPFIPCNLCVFTTGRPAGIKETLFNAFTSNSTCRPAGLGPNPSDFNTYFAGGFPSAPSNPCGVYFLAHKLTTTWDVTLASSILNSLSGAGVHDWYDLKEPSTKGYCGDRDAAATHFGTTHDKIAEICDDFIPKFFPELKTYAFKAPGTFTIDASLGRRRLCSNSALSSSSLNPGVVPAGAPPSLVLPGLPAGVTLTLEGNLQTTFNDVTCQNFITALTDTDGFANEVYDGVAVGFTYSPLSSADITNLYNYIHTFDKAVKQWFSALWIADDSSPYENACTSCYFHSYGYYSGPTSLFNATLDVPNSILYLLFPEESLPESETNSKVLKTQYAITNTTPKILGSNLNLFSNTSIADSTGMLAWMYTSPNRQNVIKSLKVFGLTTDQYNALSAVVSDAVSNYAGNFGTTSAMGLTQFGRAQLACGPSPADTLNSASPRCYMESTFFGLTNRPYFYEYAYASFVIPTPHYFQSFVSDAHDSAERDSVSPATVGTYLTNIQSAASDIFAAPYDEGIFDGAQRYFWFLMSTYSRAASVSSTSGIFAKRTAFQWLSGYEDTTVAAWGGSADVDAEYAIDPDGSLVTLTVQTGASDILTAYLYTAVNGAGSVSVYTPESIVDTYNFDGLPPTKVAPGSSVSFFSPYLMRNLKVTFASETTDEASGITSTKGSFSDADWASGTHNITQKNMLPVPGVRGAFMSACNIDLPPAVETFEADPKDTKDFPTTPAVYADLGTGLVVRVDSCYVFSASTLDRTYPITGVGLGTSQNKLFTQVMRRSITQISATQSDAYLQQYRQVSDTSLAILLALVIVGGLFVLTGVVFLVFWLMRRNRKLSDKAEMDLVADPFSEKKSNVGNMKY